MRWHTLTSIKDRGHGEALQGGGYVYVINNQHPAERERKNKHKLMHE